MTLLKDTSHLFLLIFSLQETLCLFNISIFIEPTEIETQMRNEEKFNKNITLLFTNPCHIWATIFLHSIVDWKFFQVFLGHFLKKTCFSLSTSFYLNQNNSIIPVCRGKIPKWPHFVLLVCFDPLVCFIWISEVIFGSLPLFSKYGKEKVIVAYSNYLLHDSNFSYLTTKLWLVRSMQCNSVSNTVFQICVIPLSSIQQFLSIF